MPVVGLLVIGGFLFIDWRSWHEHEKLRFRFMILKVKSEGGRAGNSTA